MKHLCAALLLPALCIGCGDRPPAEKTAAAYFEALTRGDVDQADSLVAVPYSLDGKTVLRTLDEVKRVHRIILKKRGRREVPEYVVKTAAAESSLEATVFSGHVVVHITHARERGIVRIYVTSGDPPRVIGFCD